MSDAVVHAEAALLAERDAQAASAAYHARRVREAEEALVAARVHDPLQETYGDGTPEREAKAADPGPLHRPDDWQRIYGIRVVDPDGWRGSSGRAWEDPISEDEWNDRMNQSTVNPTAYDAEHNTWDALCRERVDHSTSHLSATCRVCYPKAEHG